MLLALFILSSSNFFLISFFIHFNFILFFLNFYTLNTSNDKNCKTFPKQQLISFKHFNHPNKIFNNVTTFDNILKNIITPI